MRWQSSALLHLCTLIGRQRPPLAAALLGEASLLASLLFLFAQLASALLVALRLARSGRIDAGRDDLDRNAHDIDRRFRDGLDNAAGEQEWQQQHEGSFHPVQSRRTKLKPG